MARDMAATQSAIRDLREAQELMDTVMTVEDVEFVVQSLELAVLLVEQVK